MDIGIWFWVIYVICVLFGCWSNWPAAGGNFRPMGSAIVVFILLGLLGWKCFGPPIHG